MTLLMREREIEKRVRKETREETRKETREEDIIKLVASLRFYNIPDEGILQQLVEQYDLMPDKANEFLS